MSSFLFEEFPTLRVLVGRRDHVPLREWKMPDEDPASLPESHGRACGFADLDPEGSDIEAGVARTCMGWGQSPFRKTHSQGLGLDSGAALGGGWAQLQCPAACTGVASSSRGWWPAGSAPKSSRVLTGQDWGLFGALLFVYTLKPGSWLPREKPFKNSFSA